MRSWAPPPKRNHEVSIMAPLHLKRARGKMPDPWAVLQPLGDRATRSATMLAELAVETSNNPETWLTQQKIADEVAHDLLQASNQSWHNGIAHGKWLAAQEVENAKQELGQVTGLRAQLLDLELRYQALETRYHEAQDALDRSTLRDISNTQSN